MLNRIRCAPLLAREHEQRTLLLAWSQDITDLPEARRAAKASTAQLDSAVHQ